MKRFIPSLSALVAFEAAATYRNFTRAGEDLGLTQSGVSRQIASLEDQLGLKLFERIGPRLVLSDAGRNYVQAITTLLDGLEEASIDLVRGSRTKDVLKIGVQDSLGSQWLVPRMKQFLQRAPETAFNMVPLPFDADIAKADVDVAVLRGRGAWADAHAHHLIAETVAVVAAPSLISPGDALEPSEYHRFPLIQNAHRPDSWLRWLEAKGLSRQDHITGPRFSQTTMVIEAVLSGIGLAVVPTVMIEQQLADGRLHMPLGPPVPSGLSYFVVYPLRLGVSKPVLDFRDWLLAETRHLRQRQTPGLTAAG
ncbi:LysR family transcriptional regulator [Rhodophyticola sp. CCM32]|uniref:LysR substrate-binding domain-containing protein n=1 Tax=Rhodophyticola sp. CCM32 TaxID=2916397 RepID=UPI00107F6A63|nr:LysR substrate-binding domain-containing protein [Rhodophyticola sp. CCM32]QBY00528.1 LysR family transcriptional regulator [Rhodophyticola sp. CCM32]